MRSVIRIQRQRGAVIITVCMALLFLLGFIGIAVDLGRLFIVNSELQTAMDSCALAAAQELDGVGAAINGVSDSISRARSAGITAGNLNRVNLQSPDWSGQGQVTSADMTFMDSTFTTTTVPSAARYVECRHRQPNIKMFLLQAMGAFIGNASAFPATGNVVARAIATRGSSQTTCPLPIAMPAHGPAPGFGYAPGQWLTVLHDQSDSRIGTPGYIGWASLDNSGGAANMASQLNGACGVSVGRNLGNPGTVASLVDNWNWRFGIYKNTQGPTQDHMQPDLTGYAYTDKNWPSPAGCATPCIRNAYNGATPAGAAAGAANFVTKRANFANCINTTTVSGVSSVHACETLLNISLNSEQKLLPGGSASTGGHHQYGGNRRVVLVPVTNGYPGTVSGFACMLMLQPLSIPMGDVQMEFIGDASAVSSPCVTTGLPGGAAGPLVPVLVR